MVFCRILHYFVAESVFCDTLFCRKICFSRYIHALLRGEKFNKKLCPWRKNDKYDENHCDQVLFRDGTSEDPDDSEGSGWTIVDGQSSAFT